VALTPLFQLQQLFTQRDLQADMFCPFDGKSVNGVVVNHLSDAMEGSTELSKDILATGGELDPHVHETMTALERQGVILSG